MPPLAEPSGFVRPRFMTIPWWGWLGIIGSGWLLWQQGNTAQAGRPATGGVPDVGMGNEVRPPGSGFFDPPPSGNPAAAGAPLPWPAGPTIIGYNTETANRLYEIAQGDLGQWINQVSGSRAMADPAVLARVVALIRQYAYIPHGDPETYGFDLLLAMKLLDRGKSAEAERIRRMNARAEPLDFGLLSWARAVTGTPSA